jgi:hypothetical protein
MTVRVPVQSRQAARPNEMRPGVTEEAQRVIDAMNAVEAITDPEVRARAISEVLAHQAERGTEWRKMRRQVVLDLRAQTPPVSYRRIAKMLGIGLATVQDIETGYTGSGRDRPRAKSVDEEKSAE